MPNALRVGASAYSLLSRSVGLPPPSSVTFMAWVRVTGTAVGNQILMRYAAGGTGQQAFLFNSAGTTLGVFTGASGVKSSATALALGQWGHVALTMQGTSGDNGFGYLNGALVTTSSCDNTTPDTLLVAAGVGGASYFNGAIAAIKIWNRALSREEIRREMPFALPVSRVGLNACYPVPSVRDTLSAREYGPPGYGDWSGQKYEWTKTGVITIVPGPPQLR